MRAARHASPGSSSARVGISPSNTGVQVTAVQAERVPKPRHNPTRCEYAGLDWQDGVFLWCVFGAVRASISFGGAGGRCSSARGSEANRLSWLRFWRGLAAVRARWCIPAVMGRWSRWRPRRPTGRAGARRVRVTALAVFGVAAGLAVLLAFLFHLGVAAVVVAILGTVPALYLAYLAVPGVISPPEPGAVEKPAYGRLAGQWDPVDLGVHQVIGGGPMPAYVRRPHDELLRGRPGPGGARQPAGGGPRRVFHGQDPCRLRGRHRRPGGGLAAGLSAERSRACGAAGRRDPGPYGAVAGRAAPVRRRCTVARRSWAVWLTCCR